MLRKKFELWIDESGDFIKDISNKRLNPSLVGGVLIEQGIVGEVEAEKILNRKSIHFNEEEGSLNLYILNKIVDAGSEFVIFENKERLFVIDSDTTYLNILSEGIIQLLLLLSAQYGYFELNILVATRKNTVKGEGVLCEEEYTKRLKEKVVLGIARNALTRKNDWIYSIAFDDARKSKRLMLADCVCNTYLTRTSGKFTYDEKEFITKLYKSDCVFSVFENSTEIDIKKSLAEGKFGDVIFELYFNKDLLEEKKRYLNITLERLQNLNYFAIKNQLMSITSKIDAYLRIEKDYSRVKQILIEIQGYLIPVLKDKGMAVPEFILDIILYLYTIYTHEGSVEADKQDELFLVELESVTDLFDKLKYYIMYKTRQAINQKNMLNIEACINNTTNIINILEQMKDLMSIIDGKVDAMLGDKNVMLAKAYGTRIQSWSMCIFKDHLKIKNAREDYENALKNFTRESDKVRQHLYLCQAECEASNIEDAIKLMLKTEKMDYLKRDSLAEFIRKLNDQRIQDVIYKYLAYIQIMTCAKRLSQNDIADYMYKKMIKCNINLESFKSRYDGVHPLEMIYWYIGDYFLYCEDIKKANRYYDMAIELCNLSMKEITMKVIQLGVLSSKVLSYLNKNKFNEAKQVAEKLKDEYFALKKEDVPESVCEYINDLHDLNIEDIDKKCLYQFSLKAKSIN